MGHSNKDIGRTRTIYGLPVPWRRKIAIQKWRYVEQDRKVKRSKEWYTTLRWKSRIAMNENDYCKVFYEVFKGSLSRDFLLQVFFMNQFSLGPRVFHGGHFKVFQKTSEIFGSSDKWTIFGDRKFSHFFKDALVFCLHSYNDFLVNVHFEVSASWLCCKCFFPGVADTGDKLLIVSLLPAINYLPVSWYRWKSRTRLNHRCVNETSKLLIWNSPIGYSGTGGNWFVKNLQSKILCQAPFLKR